MAIAWKTIKSVSTRDGLLELRKRGAKDFLITVDGIVLMNSMAHRSEMALGQLACARLKGVASPRVLIGGLGMGFTLKAVLDALSAKAKVLVAELNPVVIDWCRGPLAPMTDGAAIDPRVEVKICDVADLIHRYSKGDASDKFDAVILDLYTGPYVRCHKNDDPLFGSAAINRAGAALNSKGVFAVWGENYDAGFAKRLAHAGFGSISHRSVKGGFRHVVYLGWKQSF
jgi:spermidine synthase